MRKLLLLGPVLIVILSATVLACGGSDDDDAPTATPAPTTVAIQEITIRGIESGDQYLFDPKAVNVQPGTVRVTFVNAGVERPHSLVVKNKAGDADVANTDRVELGQTKVIEFTMTEEGTYKLICTIRGHEDRGMIGTLTVGRQTALGQ